MKKELKMGNRVAANASAALWLVVGLVAGGTSGAAPETVATWTGHRMFEDFSARSEMSPDGQWVLRTFVDGNQDLLRLPQATSQEAQLMDGVKEFERAAWCGNALLRLGSDGHQRVWFAGEGAGRHAIAVPPDAQPICSRKGDGLAHYTSYAARRELTPPKAIFIGTAKSQMEIKLAGVVMTARYSMDGRTIFVVARQDDGASSLLAIDTQSKHVTSLAKDLDAWPFPGPELAVAEDDKSVVLPLATLKHPDDERRQVPDAPERWLKLYRFDLKSHQLTLLKEAPRSDQTDPSFVGGKLYWVSSHTTKEVVAVGINGGAMHSVVSGKDAYAPTWSRDGKRIAFVTGDYRLVDWALPQDIGIVPVDQQARPTGPISMFIVGNHEDFPPDWSPDGRWIAWHSHRAPHAPAYYDAPGTSDDIWIRKAEDLHAPEIRATQDVWETYGAVWSPDGRELLYTSWDRNGEPGIYQVRITTFDPAAGKVVGERRFPMPKAVHSPEIAVWSPKGDEIAVTDAVDRTHRVLWIVSKDGVRLSKVASYTSETYGSVDWTPDGKALVFGGLDGEKMQIFSVNREGGVPKRISDGRGNYMNPKVSPDGRWVACSHLETTLSLLSEPSP
jgi:Tol biopolymer transport system component